MAGRLVMVMDGLLWSRSFDIRISKSPKIGIADLDFETSGLLQMRPVGFCRRTLSFNRAAGLQLSYRLALQRKGPDSSLNRWIVLTHARALRRS
jgi:hypothetical protein